MHGKVSYETSFKTQERSIQDLSSPVNSQSLYDIKGLGMVNDPAKYLGKETELGTIVAEEI